MPLVPFFLVLITTLIVEVIIVGLFLLLSEMLRRFLRLSDYYSHSIAEMITIALSIGAVVGDFFVLSPHSAKGFELNDLVLNRVQAEIVTHPTNVLAWVGLLLWLIVAGVVVSLSSVIVRREATVGSLRLLKGLHPRQGPRNASVWFEFLIGVRTPQLIVTVLSLVPFIAAVKWILTIPFLTESLAPLATAIPIMPFLLVLYSVGRTLRFRWVGTLVLARDHWWIAPKVVAYLVLALCISIPVVAIELVLGMFGWSDLPHIAARALLAFGAALVGGSLIPYSEEQALSVTASGCVTAIIYMAPNLGVTWLAQLTNDSLGTAVLFLFGAVLLGVFCLISWGHSNDDLRRA
ncbi:hypothetical protein [Rathayibacter toxicus]|uniref:hypothetical protein n=1 Tax=Rathayibacter toxicus TaxID=145458 RepID=UPI001C0583EB|nr:hypothetical protein [Rathayibacter toxicus]QWL29647.1 hypothetical protein E2R34_01990 [Rathayibacter toxicus]